MEKVTLTIDGKKIVADSKKTVLEAATENGIYIPTMCYLKKLNPIGSCRVCLVDVEGADDPMTSCQLPVMEGMVVSTKSDRVIELRQLMVKLILVNHSVDCTVCERSGECRLQDITYEFGISRQDLKAEPVERQKRYDWKLIRYNPYLCILCERCIRVCHEVQGVSAYKIKNNGFRSVIDTVDEKPLDCDFCGQCIAVCPVGAMSSGLVLQARSWELSKVMTVCSYCSVGCSINLNVKPVPESLYQGKGKIYRVTSDDNIGINNGNLCAMGRFGYQFIDTEERIKTPLIRKGDKLVPASWDEALKLVSDKFREIKNSHGGEAIAGIGSERASNEDNYLFQKFFRTVLSSHSIDNPLNMENSSFGSGLFEKFDLPLINSTEYINKADVIFTIGADTCEENPVLGNIIRMTMRDKEAKLVVAGSRDIGFRPPPEFRMVYKYGSEILLINGIIKSIVGSRESGVESQGIEGSKEFFDYLKGIKLEDVSSKTGVSLDLIKTIASNLIKAKSSVILCGREIYTHPRGVEIVHALQNLSNIINGNIMLYREHCNSQGVNDMGVVPDMYPGYKKTSDTEAKGNFEKMWGGTLPVKGKVTTTNIIDDAIDGRVKALYVMGEDIVHRSHNGGHVREALEKIDFIVVQDMFLSETALFADVVLPGASFSEREGTFTNMEGRVQKINKAIEPIGESRPDWEIIKELANRMGGNFKYSFTEDIFKEITTAVPAYGGITYSSIKNNGKVVNYQAQFRKKFRVVQQRDIESIGDNDMPFILLSGNTFFHLGALSRKSAAMNMLTPECMVEINCKDAENLKIKDKDTVTVKSKSGSITIKTKVTNKSPHGVVFIPVNFENAPVNVLTNKKDAVTRVKIIKE
ncbi:MAG: molybdopterin-dependent oxidoreductase [Nitrospinae bacterium]|nr:molybdopterin-dependent oxidoreductase [Nitrospinota bacterium]